MVWCLLWVGEKRGKLEGTNQGETTRKGKPRHVNTNFTRESNVCACEGASSNTVWMRMTRGHQTGDTQQMDCRISVAFRLDSLHSAQTGPLPISNKYLKFRRQEIPTDSLEGQFLMLWLEPATARAGLLPAPPPFGPRKPLSSSRPNTVHCLDLLQPPPQIRTSRVQE